MHIGFYGHSNCAYRSPESFLDIVATHLNATVVNTGCKQGSEERILFELKKTKKLDVAIIFHCHHSALFIPDAERDLHARDLTRDRADHLLNAENLDSEFTKFHTPLFRNLFETTENLVNIYQTYQKYFYHPDLELNRYYGALVQIEQYLTFKNIKCIHVVDKRCAIPQWLKFNGYVDRTVMEIVEQHPQTNPFFVNCVSQLGNTLIADKIIEIIKSDKY